MVALSATNVWIVGAYGTILHWAGGPWEVVSSPTINNLNAIVMMSANEGWAVGGYPGPGTILYWNGRTWDLLPSIVNKELFSVSAAGGAAWATGMYGEFARYTPLPNHGFIPYTER